MYLIVGLGNPGKEYEKTRHNAGFLVLDNLQKNLELPDFKEEKKFKAEISEGKNIILAKPTTFMNLSGDAVQKISAFYKIPPSNIIVIHDELDLPIGEMKWRYSDNTGDGGHNGVKDIIQQLGTMKFPRIKIGVSIPNRPEQMSGRDFVLSKFGKDEIEAMKEISKICEEKIKNYIN